MYTIRTKTYSVVALAWATLACATGSAYAYIDRPPGSLAAECRSALTISVLQVVEVDAGKKAITYRRLRDLKGTLPAFVGETFTHVLGSVHNPTFHHQDVKTKSFQNDAILQSVDSGKSVVMFTGPGGASAICTGRLWYTTRGYPPSAGPWVQRCSADSRLQRLFCGNADDLISTVSALLAGEPRGTEAVEHMVGTEEMLADRSGPVVRTWDTAFSKSDLWSTYAANLARTSSDGGSGPKQPKILWTFKSTESFIAAPTLGRNQFFATSLGPFNVPTLRCLAIGSGGEVREQWVRSAPLLRRPIAGAPLIVKASSDLLVFGDGFHTDESSSLRCLRASDGLPLWELPLQGSFVHVEGMPTVDGGRIYVGSGNGGVLCIDPQRILTDGGEQDLPAVVAAQERLRQQMITEFAAARGKTPQFALPPDDSQLPLGPPKRVWQQGEGRWHVDAPVAVAAGRILAASSSIENDTVGERALVCLAAEDGAIGWKTPLALNPWAAPTLGPHVFVGCSSIRFDQQAIDGAQGELLAVEFDSGKVKWQKRVPGGVLASPATRLGVLVFSATDGKVRAWDAFSGEEKWCYDAKRPFFAGVALTHETAYAVDLAGNVHALRLTDGKPEWIFDLAAESNREVTGQVYGTPILCCGRLYFSTCSLGRTRRAGSNALVCIGDK